MRVTVIAVIAAICLVPAGCSAKPESVNPVSAGGVRQASVGTIATDGNGHSAEQANIIERLKRDNQPGAIKHLYVISAYSGQVLIYSPVKGKVTSSGKRLTPTSIAALSANSGTNHQEKGLPFVVNGEIHYSGEVVQDDGTFGSSEPYLYWFTPDGRYHQHYSSGGQIIHIADQPMTVKNVVITIESIK